jgi:hypothetical protein
LGRCVPLGAENEGPGIQLLAVNPTKGTYGTTFIMEFEVSEALGREPIASVSFDRGGQAVFEPDSMPDERVHRVRWTVPSGTPDGFARVAVTAVDRAGNEARLENAPVLLIDTSSPEPSVAGVSYTSAASSPVSRAFALSADGGAVISFSYDEPVVEPVQLEAIPPILQCAPLDSATGQRTFTCGLKPDSFGEGVIELFATAADELGNQSRERLVLVPQLEFDTISPQVNLDAGVVHVRVATSTSWSEAVHEVVGQPGTVEPWSLVQVFQGRSSGELARGFGDAQGAIRIQIPARAEDIGEVSLRTSDRAGNSSLSIPVRDVALRMVPGITPLTFLYSTCAVGATLERSSLTSIPGGVLSLHSTPTVSSQTVTVDGCSSWIHRPVAWPAPLRPGEEPSVTFDSTRQRLIVQSNNTFWEWSRNRFSIVTEVTSVMNNAAMAFNPRRGVSVLAGGGATALRNSNMVHELGVREVVSFGETYGSGVTPRLSSIVVWDGVEVQLLAAGVPTNGGPLRWLGARWSTVSSGSAMPAERANAAFDPKRRQVIAVTSAATTGIQMWRFANERWARLPFDGGVPSANGSMIWHEDLDEALFNATLPDGGATVFAWSPETELWSQKGPGLSTLAHPSASAWNGETHEWWALAGPNRNEWWVWAPDSGWSLKHAARTSPKPEALTDFAAASVGDRFVVHGGVGLNGEVSPNAWVWDGTHWSGPQTAPVALAGHSMVALPGREAILVVGGNDGGNAYLVPLVDGGWSDAGWVPVPDAGIGFRRRAGLVATNVSEAMLMGGTSAGNSALFRFDQEGFRRIDSGFPAILWNFGASADETGRILVSGGATLNSTTPLSDAGFRLIVQDAHIATRGGLSVPRLQHSSVYDETSKSHIVFGGSWKNAGSDLLLSDVLRLRVNPDASVTTEIVAVADPENDENPGPRSGHFSTWNAATRRMVMYGGRDRVEVRNDVWELATAEHDPAVLVAVRNIRADFAQAKRMSIDVRLMAGATSELDGGSVDGMSVEVWHRGRWESIGIARGSSTSLVETTLSATLDSPWSAVTELDSLNVRLLPVGKNGSGRARLVVDAFELGVTFSR